MMFTYEGPAAQSISNPFWIAGCPLYITLSWLVGMQRLLLLNRPVHDNDIYINFLLVLKSKVVHTLEDVHRTVSNSFLSIQVPSPACLIFLGLLWQPCQLLQRQAIEPLSL